MENRGPEEEDAASSGRGEAVRRRGWVFLIWTMAWCRVESLIGVVVETGPSSSVIHARKLVNKGAEVSSLFDGLWVSI